MKPQPPRCAKYPQMECPDECRFALPDNVCIHEHEISLNGMLALLLAAMAGMLVCGLIIGVALMSFLRIGCS